MIDLRGARILTWMMRRDDASGLFRRNRPMQRIDDPMPWLCGGAFASWGLFALLVPAVLLFAGYSLSASPPIECVTTASGAVVVGELDRLSIWPFQRRQRVLRIGPSPYAVNDRAVITPDQIKRRVRPPWAVSIDLASWGRVYGEPRALIDKGRVVAESPPRVWKKLTALADSPTRVDPRDGTNRREAGSLVLADFKGNHRIIPLANIITLTANNHSGPAPTTIRFHHHTNPGAAETIPSLLTATIAMTAFAGLLAGALGLVSAIKVVEGFQRGWVKNLWWSLFQSLDGMPLVALGVAAVLLLPEASLRGTIPITLILVVVMLPTCSAWTIRGLRRIPPMTRDGSYACGASPWQTRFRVLLPYAVQGLVQGLLLGATRAMGIVAPLLLLRHATTQEQYAGSPIGLQLFHRIDPACVAGSAERPGIVPLALVLLATVATLRLVALLYGRWDSRRLALSTFEYDAGVSDGR